MEKKLKFEKKRNYRLVTPCCGKSNGDGKFINYQGFPEQFGYCHSCGKVTLPVSGQLTDPIYLNQINNSRSTKVQQQYVPEKIIWNYYRNKPENNLIRYLKKTYEHGRVQETLERYAVGTCKDGGTVFWMINENQQIQKCKVAFYDAFGKRTDRFKVPYKNEGGYYACLFGAHLLIELNKGNYIVVLVESEKTAIVGDILLPQFTWLAYGGLNGLTNNKISCLKDHKVLLIPDISNQAVLAADKKVMQLREYGVKINLWDMREGKTDEELKAEGIYNNDLEDYFRLIAC